MTTPTLTDLQQRGFVIHPLRGKVPVMKEWQKLTASPPDIEKHVEAGGNVGAVCGKVSNITVIDLDSFLFAPDIFGAEIETLKAQRTEGRGHVYFKYNERLPSSKHHDLEIELLNNGNNIVLPGSKHPSGDIYHWKNPDAPIIDMPAEVEANLLRLFKTETELKCILAKCRHCFRDAIKRKPDMHGADGREMMLAVCTDMKANGADEQHIKMFARLMYREKFDKGRTLQEWRNIDPAKTWTCETLKAKLPAYVDLAECEKCDQRRQTFQNRPDLVPAPRMFSPAELTDVGNARRLVEKHGQDIHYVAAWSAWMHWNGKIWEKLDEDKQGYPQLLKEWAKEVANSYRIDASTNMSPSLAKEYSDYAKRSESNFKIKAMLNLITGERGIMKSYKDFDNSPFLFSCQNGTLNLLTQKLQEHRREDYLTKISPVIFDPDAKCERWLAFLERIMQSNPDMIAYIQNLAGQCLTGEVRQKAFWIFWGAGGDNGKTTFIEEIQYILSEYGQTVPINALLRENRGNIPTDLHSLMGARLAYASEPDIGDELTAGMIKRITGKDTMKTRTLHEKPSQWKAQFKLIIATNNKPKISDPSDAMWGRVKCVPFTEKIPENEQDVNLWRKLIDESSGILNWMIAGCMKWLANGMKEPELITQTVQDYREGSDKLAEWFNYCFEKKYDGFVPFKIYYSLYKLWCANHEVRPVQEQTLPRLLENRGFKNERGWWMNSKDEKVRDRGCFGFHLKSWLSGIDTKSVTEIRNGKLVDRDTGFSVTPPVQLILETMDSDFEGACGLFGQMDRENRVESIYLVSCEDRQSNVSSVSSMSHVSDIPIFPLDSDSVQSVQSVQNNINSKIIELLKESFDSYTLQQLLKDYKDIDGIKAEMERVLLRNLDEIPDNINLMKYIDDYWQERDKQTFVPQIEKIKILKDIIKQAQDKDKTAASQDYIIAQAGEAGVDMDIVVDMLGKLKFAGEVIEVSEGRYRVI